MDTEKFTFFSIGKPNHVLPSRSWQKLIAAPACLFLALFLFNSFYSISPLSLPQDHRCQPHPHTMTYDGEHISWTPCGTLDDHDLECSSIDVPMDQFNASNNANNQSFSIPLLRMRGKNATHNINILLNPGGPGGSGTNFIHRRGAQISTIIGEGFHLVGFDPRGINGSRPVGSCYPGSETRSGLSAVHAKRVAEDSGELWAWAENHVRACVDTMGEYAGYINTPQTAADMNSILNALGQDDMFYWGFSYGSLLGQTYATLFPERSKRVIIDGVVNHFKWYDSPFATEDFVDSDNVLSGFFDECYKVGPDVCALASLADTKEKLSRKILAAAEKLIDDPVPVYINNSVYGVLDNEAVVFKAIFSALYAAKLWLPLANNLASLLRGNATGAFLAYGWEAPGPQNASNSDDAGMFVFYNDGASGPDEWPQAPDRLSLVGAILAYYNQSTSIFSRGSLKEYFVQRAWAVPRGFLFAPKSGVQTAHPLLVLSTTYDPICPLVSAKAANKAFEGSRLAEVKGYGHCSLAVPSVCMARLVRAFLYEGRLPKENVQCDGDGSPYFAKPGENGTVVPLVHFEDPDEQRIHLAQVELAQDSGIQPLRVRW